MLGSLLVLVLAAGEQQPAPEWTKVQEKTLVVQVPATWVRSVEDGTQRFTDPSGDAYLLLDVGAVQTAGMKPQVCLDKILAAMGNGDWKKQTLGRAPAARGTALDTTPDQTGSVQTVTYVGCDGKTTWSLVFHMDTKRKDHFEPMADKVASSIAYAKAPPGKKGK